MTVPLHAFAGAVAQVFVASLWQGGVVALLAAMALRLLPSANASTRYLLVSFAFVTAVLLPFVGLLPGASHPPARVLSDSLVAAASLRRFSPTVAVCIATAWLLAAAWRASQLLVAAARLRAIRRNAAPLALSEIALHAGSRRARLCSSADVDTPTVLGFRKPVLLVPAWMVPTLSQDDLRQIALHECEHLRRLDDWINLLQQVALVLLPLQPSLLWMSRRLSVEREFACDAAVVAHTAEPFAYATCLTRLAEQRLHYRQRVRLALAAWERRSELAQRVHALLRNRAVCSPRRSRAALALCAAVLLAGSVAMARAPQLVSFAVAPPADTPNLSVGKTLSNNSVDPALSLSRPDRASYRFVPAAYTIPALPGATTQPLRPKKVYARLPARRPTPLQSASVAEMAGNATIPAQDWIANDAAATTHSQAMQVVYRTPPAHVHRAPRDPAVTEPTFVPAYAAVPFGDGWLLIQLSI